MEKDSLMTLTADIVAAHVSNNTVAISDVGDLVHRVHRTLEGLASPEEKEAEPKQPVVSVRSSVKPDYLICMECGQKRKMLRGHLRREHGMTPEQYRADYGLPGNYPMTAPNYSERRRDLAKASGLGRKPGRGRKAGKKEG